MHKTALAFNTGFDRIVRVIGVLGGHLTGGNSPNTSYVADIQALYACAVKTL